VIIKDIKPPTEAQAASEKITERLKAQADKGGDQADGLTRKKEKGKFMTTRS